MLPYYEVLTIIVAVNPAAVNLAKIPSKSVLLPAPVGIPIVAPGEKITLEVMNHISFLRTQDCILTGTEDPAIETILVLGS